jgi:hypothetical protein
MLSFIIGFAFGSFLISLLWVWEKTTSKKKNETVANVNFEEGFQAGIKVAPEWKSKPKPKTVKKTKK